jgi:predicted lipoprotein
MKRSALVAALLIAAGVVWRFPLFHVVSLGETPSVNPGEKFSPAEFAESFWIERLLPSFGESPDVAIVLAALRENPKQADQQFGRTVGVSRSRLLCVRGEGTIVSIDREGVGVSIENAKGPADIVLHNSLLFGNTVRDATGLLDAGEYSDSRQFNEISAELNRIVETKVIAKLNEGAKVGKPIKFFSCGLLPPDSNNAVPLRIIPLDVEFE